MAYVITSTRFDEQLTYRAEDKRDAHRIVMDLYNNGIQIDQVVEEHNGEEENFFYVDLHMWAFRKADKTGFIDYGEGYYKFGSDLNDSLVEDGEAPVYEDDLIYWTEDGTLSGYVNPTGYRYFEQVIDDYFGLLKA